MQSLAEIISRLSSPVGDVKLSQAFCYVEENAGRIISSTDDLCQLLSCIHSIIDASSKTGPDVVDASVSDIAKSHALSTYTNLVIQFADLGKPIRGQYTRALVEMVQRRNVKRREYVSWYLRSVACECLSELELAFPGEVTDALKVSDWLSCLNAAAPPLVEAVQEEQLASFESYSRLLLCCCIQYKGDIRGKAMLKIFSLVLDSLEFSSSWFRGYVARSLPRLVRAESDEHMWTHAVVLHHFGVLLDSVHAHQVHAFLCLSRPFLRDWDKNFSEKIVERLFAIVGSADIQTLPVRQAAVYWLCELAENDVLHSAIFERRKGIVPLLGRDAWQLVEVKLQAVLRFGTIFKKLPANLFPSQLRLNGAKGQSGAVFRFLTRVLVQFSSSGPSEFLIEALRKSNTAPEIIPSLVRLLQVLEPFSREQHFLLVRLGEFLNTVFPASRTISFFPILAFMAAHASFDPCVVIDAAKRFNAESCSWKEGLKLLEIARLVLLHHGEKNSVKDQVVSLLLLVERAPVDVRDRAITLRQYVGKLSDSERCVFLSCRFDPLKQTASDQEPPCDEIVETNESVFDCVAFAKNYEPRKNLGIADENWAIFTEKSEIVLPFTLQFNDSSSYLSLGSLFGIELSFSLSDAFERIAPVKIPYLARPTPQDAGSKNLSFPYKFNVLLRLVPVNPVPATFFVEMSFTDEHGQSHRGQLTEFKVCFEDLFAPVSRPRTEWASLFRSKWKRPFAKLLSLPRDILSRRIEERLSHFLIDDENAQQLPAVEEFDFDQENLLYNDSHSSSISEKCLHRTVLIFLPPAYHLLLRFVMGRHTCVVWIATDRTDLLALLDPFFSRWLNQY